jgi:hypothetical protein
MFSTELSYITEQAIRRTHQNGEQMNAQDRTFTTPVDLPVVAHRVTGSGW